MIHAPFLSLTLTKEQYSKSDLLYTLYTFTKDWTVQILDAPHSSWTVHFYRLNKNITLSAIELEQQVQEELAHQMIKNTIIESTLPTKELIIGRALYGKERRKDEEVDTSTTK